MAVWDLNSNLDVFSMQTFLFMSGEWYRLTLDSIFVYLMLNNMYSYFPGRSRVARWVRYFNCLATHINLSPIQHGFAPGFVNYKKGALDSQLQVIRVYQLLAHGRWFSPGTPASSTTKTGRHDIADILLKVALNTKIKSWGELLVACGYI